MREEPSGERPRCPAWTADHESRVPARRLAGGRCSSHTHWHLCAGWTAGSAGTAGDDGADGTAWANAGVWDFW